MIRKKQQFKFPVLESFSVTESKQECQGTVGKGQKKQYSVTDFLKVNEKGLFYRISAM